MNDVSRNNDVKQLRAVTLATMVKRKTNISGGLTYAGLKVMSTRKINWLIKGFLKEGDQMLIGGAPKAAKSWFAMNLSHAIATGGKFLDYTVGKPKVVMYINLEIDERTVSERIKIMTNGWKNIDMHSHNENLIIFSKFRTIDILDNDDYVLMQKLINKVNPDIIVFDVLSKTHNEDENDNGVMKNVMLQLRFVCGARTSVVVHHSRKPAQGQEHENVGIHGIRGASSITGEPDVVFALVKLESGGAKYSIKPYGRAVEFPTEFLLNTTPCMEFYEAQEEQQKAIDSMFITAFTKRQSLTAGELLLTIKNESKCGDNKAKTMVAEALAKNLIRKIGGHKGQKTTYLLNDDGIPF